MDFNLLVDAVSQNCAFLEQTLSRYQVERLGSGRIEVGAGPARNKGQEDWGAMRCCYVS
jgi:hypothetical protein